MTPTQLKLVHIAKRQLDLSDPQYKTILLSAAGVDSATKLNNQSFEFVMAVMEEQGFRHAYKPENYWRDKVDAHSRFANERQLQKIQELARGVRYSVPQQCEKFSCGRTCIPSKLTPIEAYKLIEMLKAVWKRTKLPELLDDDSAAAEAEFNDRKRAREGANHGLFDGHKTATA